MLTKSQRHELERLLRNYLMAIGGDGGGGGMHPMWRQAGRAKRVAPSVPVLYGEAERVQRALRAMSPYLKDLLLDRYNDPGLLEDKAIAHKMGRATYCRWVNKAESAFLAAYRDAHTFAQSVPMSRAPDVDLDQPFEPPISGPKRRKKRKCTPSKPRASASAPGR